MRTPSAAELLDVWERGLPLPRARRALALLESACPELSPDDLAALSIDRRDARLLELRDLLLGPELTIVAICPACGEQLESTFHSADIRAETKDVGPILAIEVDYYRISFRLPTSEDLLALSPGMDRSLARRILFDCCILEAERDGDTADAASLPEHVVAAVAAHITTAAPQAGVELALCCPFCAHSWQTVFDIADFFWQEFHAWAKSMLRSVCALARAYGWREADILALTPTRRQIYLELARQ
jgi:hypothetical protein